MTQRVKNQSFPYYRKYYDGTKEEREPNWVGLTHPTAQYFPCSAPTMPTCYNPFEELQPNRYKEFLLSAKKTYNSAIAWPYWDPVLAARYGSEVLQLRLIVRFQPPFWQFLTPFAPRQHKNITAFEYYYFFLMVCGFHLLMAFCLFMYLIVGQDIKEKSQSPV